MKTRVRIGVVAEVVVATVFFASVAVWWFRANPFAGEIVAPMDLLMRYAGWAESGLEWPLSRTRASDITNAFLPRWIFMRDAIHEGHLPLWTPVPAGGQPAFGMLSDAYFTPRFLLFVVFDEGLGFTLGLLVQAAICGLGTYLLCRTALGVVPSLFAGVTYMMCGFNSFWAMWQQTATAAWIPWILWSLVRLAERPSARSGGLVSLFVAFLVFGGYPPVGGFGLYAAGLFTLWLLATAAHPRARAARFAAWAAGGVVLGFGLTGVQLLPFAEYLSQLDLSNRRGGASGIPDFTTLWNALPDGRPGNVAYVGLAPLGLAILSVPGAIFRRKYDGPLSPVFWLPLTALALVAAFGRPEPLAQPLYRLPVFNFSLASRLFVIHALGMAVLSACGLALVLHGMALSARRLSRAAATVAAGGVGAAVLVIQIHDLAPLGRAQNPVVPAETFYPQTPALRHVGTVIQPGQSVLATVDAFGESGTVGARGFPEWFAHAFHAQGEKETLDHLVSNPWVSPTAAQIHLAQVTFDPEWFDAFGVCCVLAPRGSLLTNGGRDHFSPGIPPHRIGQTLRLLQRSAVSGVEVSLKKGRWQVAMQPVELVWFDRQGHELAAAQATGNQRSWVHFPLEPPLELESGEYRFELSLRERSGGPPIHVSTRVVKSHYRDGHLTIDGQEGPGDLTFRVRGSPILDEGQWRTSTPGPNIVVIERIESPPGAYLVHPACPRDEPKLECMDWDGIRLIEQDSDHSLMEVDSRTGGRLVRTARHWPGWKVLVNGEPRAIEPHLKILPSVAIDRGRSTVEWRYEPTSWKIGLVISTASLFALLILLVRPAPLRRTRDDGPPWKRGH